jgi:predicted RNase H-like HicB family nuclease
MRFQVTLDRDEDGMWVVECPSIPGCVSQGRSKEEALENIQEAIALCLEVRAEQGLPFTIETREVEVPDHKEIAKGTLRSLIRLAGLTVEQFLSLR